MLTRRMIQKAMKMEAQFGERGTPVPRDRLPASYYARKNHERIKRKSLEERARGLLRWKITKKGETPNPFANIEERYQLIQYMLKNDYIIQRGETPKSLRYEVTPKGRKWALGK